MLPPNHQTLTLDQLKLSLVRDNFNPFPFFPSKTLNFSSHEELFRALNLWEFANLDLSFKIRSDLLIPFIANYDPLNCQSFVRNVVISVTRSELARALKLEEDHNGETHKDIFVKDESKEAILELMSKYILIEDEDDMCILPEEAVMAAKMVREGKANEVDWIGLMWVMIEKEILGAQRSGVCRFALHVQCLIKCQHPDLFEEELGMEVTAVDPEPVSSIEVSDSEDEESDDKYGVGVENGDLMDCIEHHKGEDERNWFREYKDLGFEHCLQRCSSNKARGIGFESICKGDEFPKLARFTSTDLHVMDTVVVSCSPRINSFDENAEQLLSVSINKNTDDSVFYENNAKRHIESIDVDAEDIGWFHPGRQKRARYGGTWEEQAASGFDTCMEEIQCTMVNAKMLYSEKEQECLNVHLQIQCLNEMLKQKDQLIQTLEKTRVEECERWQNAVYQYEHELNVLANLVSGYRRALKKTQNEFEEYRKKCPQGDQPLFKDVGGDGGLVLTSREVEKLQLEKKGGTRQTAEEMISAFQCDWAVKFEGYTDLIMKLQGRLIELDGKVEHIKEFFYRMLGYRLCRPQFFFTPCNSVSIFLSSVTFSSFMSSSANANQNLFPLQWIKAKYS